MANITPSEINFRLRIMGQAAKEHTAEPARVEQFFTDLAARLKAEAEDERQRQEQVDGLAESMPVDLADYPQREV